MAKRIEWRGSFYSRVRSNDFRNRNTGDILKNVKVKKIKGRTNKIAYFNGKSWVGVEKNYNHIYSFDPKKSESEKMRFKTKTFPSAKRRFETAVRANHPSAKKRRTAHRRRI